MAHLSSLPSELIDSILRYLSASDLSSVSRTCRILNRHTSAEHLWQALVQENVPGATVSSPYPFKSFRELYAAHDPLWFIPRHKIWFSDRDLTGKLVVARFDPRRGCIEGYQLLAVSDIGTAIPGWSSEVMVHEFRPQVKLHLDRAVLELRANGKDRKSASPSSAVSVIPLRGEPSAFPSAPASATRFSDEMPLDLDRSRSGSTVAHPVYSNFSLAAPLPAGVASSRAAHPFPYGSVWPPPSIPSPHRVAGASRTAHLYHRRRWAGPRMATLDECLAAAVAGAIPLEPSDRPTSRTEVSETAFRIRTWLEMRAYGVGVGAGGVNGSRNQAEDESDSDHGEEGAGELPQSLREEHLVEQLPIQPAASAPSSSAAVSLRIGEDTTTYATLDPKLYTPTETKPWRGIYVGDYSGHGCEFLLVHQPDDEDDVAEDEVIIRKDNESDNEFAQRQRDARIYRGRLEAIKLTGDPNVPRGEYSILAEDLGDKGLVTTFKDGPFPGARMVHSKGHIAETGFVNGKDLFPSELSSRQMLIL
jgi:hypothetical protein